MDSSAIRFAYTIITLLIIILGVSVVAYRLRSRIVFWLGLASALTSLLVPLPKDYSTYRSVEGAIMSGYERAILHTFATGFVFAIVGILLGIVIPMICRPNTVADATSVVE